jgi:hypothetical protein
MSLRIATVTVDCAEPGSLARWWAEALGWKITFEEPDEVVIEGEGATPVLFLKNPDAKSVKNRLHFDLRPGDQAKEVARLEAMGARRIDIGQGADVTWGVMADPEGNEFCVLRALTPEEIAKGVT